MSTHVDDFNPAAMFGTLGEDGKIHGAPTDYAAADRETTGQTRMAYRLARHHAGGLLHVYGLGWLNWTGTHWAEDKTGAATRAVLDVLRTSHAEAFTDDALRKDVKTCNSASGIEGVLRIAAALPEFTATVDDLDANPYLLNCANGALDLQTMQFRAHDPADRCTRITAGAYDPKTKGTTWRKFLDTSLPDQNVQGFLQRYVGQALVGRVLEQKLAILTGEGGNGKGVFYGAVGFTLGEYAFAPQNDMLLTKKHESAFDGSVELRGRRWAVFSEVDKGRQLAAATVKRLTGDDLITARQLYQKNITFRPSHTFAMIANHLPEVPDTGHGMWRRLMVVPFDVTVPADQQDEDLKLKLEAEADAILTWAVEGWCDYQERGLDAPDAVLVATGEYRHQSDQIARFLSDATFTNPTVSCTTTVLHKHFQEWARLNDVDEVPGSRTFGEQLREHGLSQDSRRAWKGIGVRPGWEDEQ